MSYEQLVIVELGSSAQKGIAYSSCVCTEPRLKDVFATSHRKAEIYKNTLDGTIGDTDGEIVK